MKNGSFILLILFFGTYSSFSQGVGIGTTTPDASAVLDITGTSKGLLIPRMNTASIMAIVNPANGLLVYDAQINQLKVNVGTPAAPNFQPVSSGSSGWNLSGNSGINPANQFIGTTDNQPLRFRINNIQAGELHPVTGNIFWGLRAGTSNTTGFSNIAIGNGALKSNTVSTNLVAVGDSALFNNGLGNPFSDEAAFNTAIGSKSLFANRTGAKNTSTGYNSLFSNTNGSFNTATGFQALFANTTGFSNTAVGFNAISSNTIGVSNTGVGNLSQFSTIGSFNTAVGDQSLFSNSFGNDNTAIGFKSLFSNTVASGNTAVGFLSLSSNSVGSGNTAVGNQALQSNTTGLGNTAMGIHALSSNTIANRNTAIGSDVLTLTTEGIDNTGVGSNTLRTNTTGQLNTGIGVNSLLRNTTGSKNTAVGMEALKENVGGVNNTALGQAAMFLNTTGNFNVAVGTNALSKSTNSEQNTAIGFNAGSAFDAASNNVFIGANADVTSNNLFNCVAIGNDAKCGSNNQIRFGNSTTSSIGGIVGFTNFSDGRYKKNVQEDVKGIDFIMKLRPVTYQLDIAGLNKKLNINAGHKTGGPSKNGSDENEITIFSGFVAQEVELAAKQTGYDFSGVDKPKNENDLYGLRYAEFVVPLVKAMQEQQAIIKTLQMQVEATKAEIPMQIGKQQQMIVELKNENADLQKRLLALEKMEGSNLQSKIQSK